MSRHGILYNDIVPFMSRYYDKGKFGRMFPSLPPFAQETKKVREALIEMGEKGGIMDANDDLTKTPVELITQPNLNTGNPNSPIMTAGMTFLGQFIDHDITFDPTSSLERQVDPEFIENFRTPGLSLDNVYGSGPGTSPHLYDQSASGKGIKMLLEPISSVGRDGITKFDVPRNTQLTALIGDPRNDENLVISQLQVIFLRFHNIIVDALTTKFPSKNPSQIFAEAQELVRWHYQWIILHEYLPLTCGEAVVNDILKNSRQYYGWHNSPFIPVEFSVAAFRFGHSQIRPSYRANFGEHLSPGSPFFANVFDFNLDESVIDPDDLRGGKRSARRYIDWHTFFNLGDGSARPNKLIDTKISTPLFNLLGFTDMVSLASRNLLRGLMFKLPSGQRVAHAMGLQPLDAGVFDNLKKHKVNFEHSTPLWYYILKEAEVQKMGLHLGDVGARIVAEVFIGLLEGDNSSYLSQNPFWKPVLPCWEGYRNGRDFTMADLIRIAEEHTPLSF